LGILDIRESRQKVDDDCLTIHPQHVTLYNIGGHNEYIRANKGTKRVSRV